MSRPMIVVTMSVLVVAVVLALMWTMQRRMMYFPIGHLATPGEIGLTQVEPVTLKTTDGLELSAWFLGRHRRASLFSSSAGMLAIERTGVPWPRRFVRADCRSSSLTIGAMAGIRELRAKAG